MLSALFGSPRYLLQKDAQAEQVAAEQRVSQARRRSISIVQARSRSSSNEAAADAKSPAANLLRHDPKDKLALDSIKPTMRDRRASLGLETGADFNEFNHKSDTSDAGDEIPAASDESTISGRHSRSGSFPTPAVLPYTLHSNGAKGDELPISDTMPGDPEVLSPTPAQPPSNHLALIDIAALFSSVTSASSKDRSVALLSKAARIGFESGQRSEVWKRMVVLPSSMTQVDRMAYYRVVESCFRLQEGSVTTLAADLIHLEEESLDLSSEPIQALRAELRAAMPSRFPNPPLLGRSSAFDFAAQVPPGVERVLATEMVLAPKRIVCALSFATPDLSYAPQLAALVSLLYHTFDHDEATTFAFARAMLDRSGRDEFFVLRAPSSSVLVSQGFARVVEKHLPALYAHLSLFCEIGARDTRVESKWFAGWIQDLFIGSLPNEAVARMIDLSMAVGIVPAAYKLGLQVLALFSPYLLSTKPVVGGLAELERKLAKLMSIANIPSLFGADASGITWTSDVGLYTAKKDLARLTTPTPLGASKDACICLDALVAHEDTHLGLEALLASKRFHQPSFHEDQHYGRAGGRGVHNGLMDTRTLLQLYSGILPAPASQMDPTLVFASNRDGHSLRGMIGRLAAFHDAHPVAGGVLLLVRENGMDARFSKKKGRVLALFLNQWPKDLAITQAGPSSTRRARSSSDATAASSDSITLESGGFVAEFPEVALHAAGELDPRWVRFGGGLRVDPASDVVEEMESKDSIEAREVADAETAPTSLPILPVERPESFVKPPLKRRGSIAVLMEALKLNKSDESSAADEAPNPLNSPAAQKLLALVPKLSPFRHQGLRVIENVGSKAIIHSAVHAAQHQHERQQSDWNASTVTSSAASSPALSRRASLVAGLGKVWSFIDSVPTPHAQSASNSALSSRAGSKASSPATSRRGSLTLQSARNAGAGPTDGVQRPPLSVFFSLGGSSPAQSNLSSPMVASNRSSSSRANPPLTGLRGRPPANPLLSPAASREAMAGIERHLTLARKESDSRATPIDSPSSNLQRRGSVRVAGLPGNPQQQSLSRPRSPETKQAEPTEHGSRPRLNRAMSLPAPVSPPIAAATAVHAVVVAPTPQRKHAASTSSAVQPSLTVPARSVNSSPSPSHSSHILSPSGPSPVASPGPESVRSPVASASTPREPTIASLCASFRNQHGFNLTVDEDDEKPEQTSSNHCDTVRAALRVIHRGAATESTDHDSSHPTLLVGARIRLTSDALLISAPSIRLLWSVDGTLEEGCISWQGMPVQSEDATSALTDPASARIDIGSLECWSFQSAETPAA